MATTWFPPGWALDVPNPGYGELILEASLQPFRGVPLVREDWTRTLNGPQLGEFLAAVTARALQVDAAPPAQRRAARLRDARRRGRRAAGAAAGGPAGGGGHRAVRAGVRRRVRAAAAAVLRHLWRGHRLQSRRAAVAVVRQHGHQPFGMGSSTRWDSAQELHQSRRQRWERQQELAREQEAWQARLAERHARTGERE